MIASLPVAVIDTETWCDITIIGLLLDDGENRTVRQFTTMEGIGEPMQAFREWYAANSSRYLFIGFNSAAYDNFIVNEIMQGSDDPEELYHFNRTLIEQDET